MNMNAEQAREQIWAELRKVGKPDTRFHWDFAEFIADYVGSDQGAEIVREQEAYQQAAVVFITPDNNMRKLREYTLKDKKTLIMTTYGINRGFQIVRPGDVPEGKEELASTLDGIELFITPITLAEIKEEFDQIPLLFTGASAMKPNGLRFGKGHGYFDLEWGMMWEMGIVSPESIVFGLGHDCQIVDAEIEPEEYDTVVDYIVTPTRCVKTENNHPKPTLGIIWDKLEAGMFENIPPLQEVYRLKGK
ncbi:methenyltetrahydrofolate synthetase [Bacillus sp. SD088]|nr:methenyltetrahydrofolate synthetase [Bacillus sp. SD088]